MSINEFSGLKFSKQGNRPGRKIIASGEEALELYSLTGTVRSAVKPMAIIVGLCWSLSIASLIAVSETFAKMQDLGKAE